MEVIHQIINSVLIAIIAIIIYVQKQSIQTLNKSLEAIDIDKILASKKYLDLARDKEIEIAVKEKEREVVDNMLEGIKSGKDKTWDVYTELLLWHVEILDGMNEKDRNKIITALPKNQEFVSILLLKYQSGGFVGRANHESSPQQVQD